MAFAMHRCGFPYLWLTNGYYCFLLSSLMEYLFTCFSVVWFTYLVKRSLYVNVVYFKLIFMLMDRLFTDVGKYSVGHFVCTL